MFFTATRNGAGGEQMARLSALRFFQQISVGSPLVVVPDEVTRLASACADLGNIISAVWESPPPGCQLMLVICSSAVGAMRDLIGPEGGLYRRATVELRLDPLGIADAASLLGEGSTIDPVAVVEGYAACGGNWSSGVALPGATTSPPSMKSRSSRRTTCWPRTPARVVTNHGSFWHA